MIVIASSVAKFTYIVAEITFVVTDLTFLVADISLLVVKITFGEAETALTTSSLATIFFVVAEITFKKAVISGQDHFGLTDITCVLADTSFVVA